MMDNRIFNVNGKSKELLLKSLELAFEQSGYNSPQADAWAVDYEKGMVFLWSKEKDSNTFPCSLGAKECAELAWSWLQSDDAKKVACTGWDADGDHDGDNGLGWRIYCEGWGHVGNWHYSIVAVRPSYLWYGK